MIYLKAVATFLTESWNSILTTLEATRLFDPQTVIAATQDSFFKDVHGVATRKAKLTAARLAHRLVAADGVNLGPEHDGSEDQKEEAFEAEEDEEDDGGWWREVTALWQRGKREKKQLYYQCKIFIAIKWELKNCCKWLVILYPKDVFKNVF